MIVCREYFFGCEDTNNLLIYAHPVQVSPINYLEQNIVNN